MFENVDDRSAAICARALSLNKEPRDIVQQWMTATNSRLDTMEQSMAATNACLDTLTQQIENLIAAQAVDREVVAGLRHRVAEIRTSHLSQATLGLSGIASPIYRELVDDLSAIRGANLQRLPEYLALGRGTKWLYQTSVLYLMSQRGLTAEFEIDYLASTAAGKKLRAARRAIDDLEEYGLPAVLKRQALKRGHGGYRSNQPLSSDWDDLEKQRAEEIKTAGLIIRRTYPLWPTRHTKLRISLLRLTEAGKAVCRKLGWEPLSNEWDQMIAGHGGDLQVTHTAAAIMLTMNARQRGFRTTLLPQVISPTQPDILLERDGQKYYLEVELSDGSPRNRSPLIKKWRNMERLQGFVAVCAKGVRHRGELVRELRAQRIPYLATDLESLYAVKFSARTPNALLFAECAPNLTLV